MGKITNTVEVVKIQVPIIHFKIKFFFFDNYIVMTYVIPNSTENRFIYTQ